MTQSTDDRLAYIERQIISLEKDGETFKKAEDKFELTVSKIGDAVNSIERMLAVHDNAIHRHNEVHKDLYDTLDSQKRESAEDRKALMTEIEKANKNLDESIGKKITKLDDDISEKLSEINECMTDHDRRIRGLERITFIGLGLAMLIGLLVDKIPFDKIF